MAIAYARVVFRQLATGRSAQRAVAYLARVRLFDRLWRQIVDFTGIAKDLVHLSMLLPANAAAAFANFVEMARAIDAVEAGRLRRPPEQLLRPPQLFAEFVVALPPDSEVTYDQAVELANRFAGRVRENHPIAMFMVIHDPALEAPGSVNRHLHLVATTRGLDRRGFGLKIRGLFARPKHALGPSVHSSYIAEGTHWPGVMAALLRYYFFELGLDVVVDPHLPIGGRHFSAADWRFQTDEVVNQRHSLHLRNCAIVMGAPAEFVDSIRRGRTAITVAELHRVLAQFYDRVDECEARLDQILAHPDVVTYSIHPHDHRPSRLTTRAVHNAVTLGLELAEQARKTTTGKQQMVVVSGSDEEAVLVQLSTMLAEHSAPGRILLTGQMKSHGLPLQTRASECTFLLTSIAQLIEPQLLTPYAIRSPIEVQSDDIIVVPKSEQTDDELLARLIAVAAACRARLILGYDESRQAGVVANRVASWLAERSATSKAELALNEIAPLLRCGQVEHPVRVLDQHGLLKFDADARQPEQSAVNFSVCDDAHELFQINTETVVTDAETLEYGPFTLVAGQWVAFTSTDYKSIPPVICAGRLARIVHFLDERRLLAAHADDSLHEIDLREFPHVRPARAITIAEARYAPMQARLQIHLTKSRHAWSALYLAAVRGKNASIQIDPRIAKNVDELIAVGRRSVPAALPIELIVCPDLQAELTNFLTVADAPVPLVPSSDDNMLERFPEPDAGGHWQEASDEIEMEATTKRDQQSRDRAPVRTEIQSRERELLHEQLRTVLASTREGQTFLDGLEEVLGPRASNRKEAFQQIRALIDVSAPTIELARLIYERGNAPSPSTDEAEDANLDEMLDFERPREWSKRDIDAFKLDIVTFKRSRMWDAVFDPNPSPEP